MAPVFEPLGVLRRSILTGLTATAALAAASFSGAAAQEERAPVGDIEITIGAGAGSGPDIVFRTVADILNSEGIVENPIVVNNRTGGGWTVASNYVLSQAGNENLLFGMSPTPIATPITQGLPNTYDKLTPLARLLTVDLMLVVPTSSPLQTFEEFIEFARSAEFAASMAGANIGSTDHIALTKIEQAADVKINYIPYDGGGGQILSALLGGQVTAITIPPDEIMSLIESGEVRPLAMLAPERNAAPELAEVPTAAELGYDVAWSSTQMLALPPDTDPALVAWWDARIAEMVASQRWQDLLVANYYRNDYIPASGAGAAMQEIHDRMLAAMTDLGLAQPQPAE
jgi:putative tricarboxylic transport membrane protein